MPADSKTLIEKIEALPAERIAESRIYWISSACASRRGR